MSEEIWNNLYDHARRLLTKWKVRPCDLHDLAMDAVVHTVQRQPSGAPLALVLRGEASKALRKHRTVQKLDRVLRNARRRGFLPAAKDRAIFAEKGLAQAV